LFNSVPAARGFSVSTTPDPAHYLPGLDLANEVRQLNARGDNIAAIKVLRVALDASLADAAEWLRALTGWQIRGSGSSGPLFRPEAPSYVFSADALSRLFESVGDSIARDYGHSGQTVEALYRLAQQVRTHAK
jgi:hypothetical protein